MMSAWHLHVGGRQAGLASLPRSSSRWMVIALSGFLTSWATPAVRRPSAAMRFESCASSLARPRRRPARCRSCALDSLEERRAGLAPRLRADRASRRAHRGRGASQAALNDVNRTQSPLATAGRPTNSTATSSAPTAVASRGPEIGVLQRLACVSRVEMPMRMSATRHAVEQSAARGIRASARGTSRMSQSCDRPFCGRAARRATAGRRQALPDERRRRVSDDDRQLAGIDDWPRRLTSS